MESTVTKFFDDLYIIDDNRVRAFLIVQEDQALLIDTGFSDSDFVLKAKEITDLPLKVVLTHGDLDHSGNLKYFDQCYLHPDDRLLIKDEIQFNDLLDGDKIIIGNYHFEVISIPGHTYGSIALLERNKKLLLPGDSVQIGPIYMFGSHRNLDLYFQSLQKLLSYQDDIETILPSHHQYPLSNEYIKYCLDDAKLLKANKLKGTKHPTMPCCQYDGKHVSFYY